MSLTTGSANFKPPQDTELGPLTLVDIGRRDFNGNPRLFICTAPTPDSEINRIYIAFCIGFNNAYADYMYAEIAGTMAYGVVERKWPTEHAFNKAYHNKAYTIRVYTDERETRVDTIDSRCIPEEMFWGVNCWGE